MKKIRIIIFTLFMIFFSIYSVSAKDTVYSISKYKEGSFEYILKAYDLDHNNDGYVLGGNVLAKTFEKDDMDYYDYQVILVKYDKDDKLEWKYTYGENKEDYIDYLTYSYDNNEIDGYLLVVRNTYDVDNPNDDNYTKLLKLNLEGKLVYEKDIKEGIISKIIPSYDDNSISYIAILNNSLVKFNSNLDIEWKKDFNNTLVDMCNIYSDGKIVGYSLIEKSNDGVILIQLGVDGNLEKVLSEDLNKYENYFLSDSDNGFVLYGITSEVKLKNGLYSYYLINYNNGEEVWETIGDSSLYKDQNIKLFPIKDNNSIIKYFLLYKNANDSSYEVVEIDLDGLIGKKIKKINNDYYNLNDFYSMQNTIYFIGQISCPEDEKCNYNSNTLYLVSDEDKVIEVEDTTSKSIIVIFLAIVSLFVGFIVIRGRKKIK